MSKDDSPSWYRFSQEHILERLDTQHAGLSTDDADRRRQEVGPNTIRTEQEISAWKVLLDQFTSPLVYILLAALVVTLAIQSWADAIVIAIVLVVNATIGFIQEYRAESAVQSLMQMVSPKATVRRNGREQQVDGDDLVPGDIVLLEHGEMVPADLRLLVSKSLQANESALTGESVPVTKTDEALSDAEKGLPPADQENMAFMGTAVTTGSGEGVVVATGAATQLGAIAEDIRQAGEIETPLQRRMNRLAKWIAIIILAVAAIAFGIGLMMGRSITQMFLLAVSLSVAAIPAGLPVVMTVALAVGVRRMARRHAVIRHLPAVETLGSCTVIVSDKTGTLTQNQMTVQRIYAAEQNYEVTGQAQSCEGSIKRDGEDVEVQEDSPLYLTLLVGLLNNSAELSGGSQQKNEESDDNEGNRAESNEETETNGESNDREDELDKAKGDPMEIALLLSAVKAGLAREKLLQRYPIIDEVPFRTEQRFSATVHETEDERSPRVLIKGAPERLAEMSSSILGPDGEEQELDRKQIEELNERLASEGLRVLAMAIGRGKEAAESIKSDEPSGMTFVGMQGLRDPARPEAVEAVDNCHRAGIRVIMVTGDHASTAAAIASEVHLDQPAIAGESDTGDPIQGNGQASSADATRGDRSDVQRDSRGSRGRPETHTGQEIAKLSDAELDEVLQRTNVFARVKPDHKVRIVNRLKSQRQIVAVTGDGVNDAPALKSAHLGSAMGQTGTDVAKEASDMVITDDNFASVYAAVEEGRTAFRNIRMATFFLLSTGAADVLIILISLGLRWPLPLLPAQILWCNVVTNGIADVALGFEPGEKELFRRAPRPIGEGVLDRTLIERLGVVGLWLTIGTLGVFYWVWDNSEDKLDVARVAALTTLVLFQKVHVFNCRSEDVSIFKKSLFANKVLFGGVLASLIVHIAALYIPWTQKLLQFEPLTWDIWLVAIGVAATAIIVNELHKWLRPRETVNRQTAWISRLWGGGGDSQEDQLPDELRRRLDHIEQTAEQNRELLEQIKEERKSD